MQRIRLFGIIVMACAACGGGGHFGDSSKLLAPDAGSACLQLFDGPRRGLSCLHCSQPEAQAQGAQVMDVLIRSCLKNIATNFLIDGTFEFDQPFLEAQVASLATGGRNPLIVYYLVNGFAQRARYSSVIDGFGAGIMAPEFRLRIQTDEVFREAYRQHVLSRLSLIEWTISKGATVVLIPMLEDNLDYPSFEAVLALTREVVPAALPVIYGRNPCLGECHAGNDAVLPSGVLIENHTDDPSLVAPGAIVTNDGFDYEGGGGVETTTERLRVLRDYTGALNGTFILWSARRQGISTSTYMQAPPPAERGYRLVSDAEAEDILTFLRDDSHQTLGHKCTDN